MFKRTPLVLCLLAPTVLLAADSQALSFEANAGQTDPAVRYLTRTGRGTILFTDGGLVLPGRDGAVGFELRGENPAARWESADPTGRTTSYRIGRDRSRWVEDVPSYRQIKRRGVYPGIDLVYYGDAGRLEYDFRLAPHADAAAIRIRFTGARGVAIAPDGALLVDAPEGTVRHEQPHVFEIAGDGSHRAIAGSYRLLGKTEAGFRIGRHDPSLALSIDPVLDSSTYFGGSADDSIISDNGSVIVGNTSSIDFPGAAFARRKGNNVFVQLSTQTLIYGATGNVVATSAAGGGYYNLTVVGGYTDAADLPTTSTTNTSYTSTVAAWQPEFAGGATDGFLLVIYIAGNGVDSFLSYIGTPGDDRVTAVATTGTYVIAAGTTNGRGLPYTSAPLFLGVPQDTAAGVDGFLIGALSGLPSSESLLSTTYFGGSGDDTPTAALISGTGYYVAGETSSPDFPATNALPSALNGPSDAFVIRFPSSTQSTIPQCGILFGGSSTDRATALSAMTSGAILMAGMTSSPDLPLQNPAQATYGGDPSDAFFAMFPADLSALTYATYIGGSGAEQATAIATDSLTGIFVGGYTSSQDFPLQSPSQTQFGGGADDGFLAHYDLSGVRLDSTYFGGSGSDRILGITVQSGANLLVYGQTTSSDLPVQNPTQASLKGNSDGFITHLSYNGFASAAPIGARDMRSLASFAIGTAVLASPPAHISIASSDPSTILLAANSADDGQGAIQISGTNVSGYYLDCLADHGGADITFTATGATTLTVHASCYPTSVAVYYSNGSSSSRVSSAARLTMPPGKTATFTIASLINAPTGAVTTGNIVSLRPGAGLPQVQVALSNSSIGATSPVTFPQGVYTTIAGQFTFTPNGPGETQMSFSSPTLVFPDNNPLDVMVSALSGVGSSYVVPSGFQRSVSVYYNPVDTKQPLTVTSQDPSSLLVAADCTQTGSASTAVAWSSYIGFCIQAIGSGGDVGFTVFAPNEAPVQSTARITSPTLWFPSFSVTQPLTLTTGQTLNVGAAFSGADPQSTCCYTPNPGSNITLALASSNPQVIAPPAPVAVTSSGTSFSVKTAAAGNTVLSVQPPPGFAPSSSTRSLSVTVKNRPMVMADLELGNNLAGRMSITLPLAAAGAIAVHVSVSDSSLALLSTDTQSAGKSQLDLTISNGYSGVGFYVYGLAASGRTQITATTASLGSVTANVTLDPSDRKSTRLNSSHP
jgi:hypothetical protein